MRVGEIIKELEKLDPCKTLTIKFKGRYEIIYK